ncbi:unnamed protein product [Caenorhabditis auriculariae]|uniref:Uncharacterized protein n=1 Tax=Caenorhabditis auriculariae TaxID=2777116 RepID=A0A8S1HDG4_9PELO|nr:unnamed protein product [Caenorhabditis auriculariae]
MDSNFFVLTCKLCVVFYFMVYWIGMCCCCRKKADKNSKIVLLDPKKPKQPARKPWESPWIGDDKNRMANPYVLGQKNSKSQMSIQPASENNLQITYEDKLKSLSKKDRTRTEDDGLRRSEMNRSMKSVVYDPEKFKKLDNTMTEESPAVHDRAMKAAADGLILDPRAVKYQGNIDAELRPSTTDILAELAAAANDKSKSDAKKKTTEKVTINEKKCVLYETNDIETEEVDQNDLKI